jgi:cell volume regulation protein A
VSLTIENILLIGSILLIVSILAGKTSYRFGVPVLVFFVMIGMLAGSEGPGDIYFNDPRIARFIGFVALNFILFSGGLETRWESIKPVFGNGVALSTIGVLITAFAVGIFVWAITDFTIYEGLLLGAIVSSTDAAAVFSILRSKSLGLKNNLRSLLELESGSNDPMAFFLTIAFTGLILNPGTSGWTIIPLFFKQMLIGGAAGFIMGMAGKELINKIRLDFEGLYPVLVIALMFLTWSITDFIGGNGFLAIYLAAVYLGNQSLIHKKSIMQVFDGLAWLMQIILFLTLGLLVFPSKIIPVIGLGLLVSAFLIFIARPLSVYLTLIPFGMKFRNMTFISWVGLRGAVPIVFATYPLLEGVGKADMIFNLVFFISLTSVLLQGTTLARVAKWLHVVVPEKAKQRTPPDIELADIIKSELTEIIIDENCPASGKRIVDLDFPRSATIAVIKRNEKYIMPKGSTVILAGDKLVILAESIEGLEDVRDCISNVPESESKQN